MPNRFLSVAALKYQSRLLWTPGSSSGAAWPSAASHPLIRTGRGARRPSYPPLALLHLLHYGGTLSSGAIKLLFLPKHTSQRPLSSQASHFQPSTVFLSFFYFFYVEEKASVLSVLLAACFPSWTVPHILLQVSDISDSSAFKPLPPQQSRPSFDSRQLWILSMICPRLPSLNDSEWLVVYQN